MGLRQRRMHLINPESLRQEFEMHNDVVAQPPRLAGDRRAG